APRSGRAVFVSRAPAPKRRWTAALVRARDAPRLLIPGVGRRDHRLFDESRVDGREEFRRLVQRRGRDARRVFAPGVDESQRGGGLLLGPEFGPALSLKSLLDGRDVRRGLLFLLRQLEAMAAFAERVDVR